MKLKDKENITGISSNRKKYAVYQICSHNILAKITKNSTSTTV